MAAATVSSWIPPTLPECGGYDDAVLLDMRCYLADLPNATTAWGATSTGLPIQVTFHAARPPLLSHFCIHCPGLEFRLSAPKVVATNADLVLLLVPVVPTTTATIRSWDYLYRPRFRKLDLLPNPHPLSFGDSATALLSCEDGGSYAVAALSMCGPVFESNSSTVIRWDFNLHLYRSSSSEGWITKRMSVEELVRDTYVTLPDMDYAMLYHETWKTVTVGGEQGTVVWVDLWRGIFLCDVLVEHPVLQDVPLPVPQIGNWDHLLTQGKPNYIRDVNISRHKDSIKYIEMEIRQPRNLKIPLSYLQVVCGNSNRTPESHLEWTNRNPSSQVICDGWKARTWTMSIPVGSRTDWHPDCEVEVKEITVDASDPHHCNLLSTLSGSDTMPTLQEISMAYPTISMDDDIVYFLSRAKPRGAEKLQLLIAIDMKKKILQGVAELDVQKSFIVMPTFCTSEICRYLRKNTGTIEELERTANEAVKPSEKEEVKPTCEGRDQQTKVYEETCITAFQPAGCNLVNNAGCKYWRPRTRRLLN